MSRLMTLRRDFLTVWICSGWENYCRNKGTKLSRRLCLDYCVVGWWWYRSGINDASFFSEAKYVILHGKLLNPLSINSLSIAVVELQAEPDYRSEVWICGQRSLQVHYCRGKPEERHGCYCGTKLFFFSIFLWISVRLMFWVWGSSSLTCQITRYN